ncbi:MAG: 4Fe-4S dicluster domain-containing protein, partial [Clostridiales bacterium]|nr:4Fe-4S dicluster domain-containing protein [Clostridiales bacterium]
AIARPINVVAPIGTPFSHLIDEAGGFQGEVARVISGGPMMGVALYDISVSTSKATNAVLCLAAKDLPIQDEQQACIRCARCVNVCPMHLLPVYMYMHAHKRLWREVEDLRVMDCMECGSCQYICPARIPLLQSFRTAKFELRALAAKAKEGKA